MNFSKQLDFVFSALGCSNEEIARISGIDAETLVKFRRGEILPKKGSNESIMLVFGLCKYAGDNNKSAVLAKSCSAPSSANHYALNQALTSSLFASQEPHPAPSFSNGDALSAGMRVTHKTNPDHLDSAMKLLGINNIKMSKDTGIDASLISRYRSGARMISNKPEVLSALFSCLYRAAFDTEKTAEFAELLKISERDLISSEERSLDAFSSWIRNNNGDFFEYNSVARFVNYLDQLSERKPVITPAEGYPAGSEKWLSAEPKASYRGVEGLRTAFTRLMNTALQSSGSHTLYLYSDQAINWFSDEFADTAFALIKNFFSRPGNRVKIIINIEHNNPDMFSPIERCLPLFMTGKMEPYYCKKIANSRFSHTLFMVDSVAAVTSFFVSGTEDKAQLLYTDEPQKLDYFAYQWDALMRVSSPLMKIFSPQNFEGFDSTVDEFVSQRGDALALFPSLPVCTMSEELVADIISRNEINESTGSFMKGFCAQRKHMLNKALASKVSLIFPMPAAYIENGIKFSSHSFAGNETLYYSKSEYKRQIEMMINALRKENNLDFVLLDSMRLRHTQIFSKENGGVLITKCTSPVTAMYFSHPFICKSIHNYLKKITDSVASTDKNKYDIIQLLEQQISE
ncbi:MAG: hypothetical protein GX051_02995 [Clostridiales bacterium]|nr:hypothetical protein [Clostridiales bacterium]